MPVISILSQKGGSGKTTLATCLARQLQLEGEEVLLVDSDPQGSSRDWRAATDADTVPVIGMDRPTLDKDLKAVAKTGAWIVIDGAPRNYEIIVAAVKISDAVLVPTTPSPFDIWSAKDLVDLILARQGVTEGTPKAAFVVSRAIKRTELSREVVSALEEYGLPIFESGTTQRVIYPKSAAIGMTPADTEPEGDGAREIRHVVRELREFISK